MAKSKKDMKKYNIQIFKLGNQEYDYVFNELTKYQSKIFSVTIFDEIIELPETNSNMVFSTNEIKKILIPRYDQENFDICIGFLDYRLNGEKYNNIYGSNIKDNKIFVVTFYQIAKILATENIKLLNFVLVIIYRYLTRSLINIGGSHDITRGCINDMCINKTDIVFSCEKPILCHDCMREINKQSSPKGYILRLEKELKKIRTVLYYKIIRFIKKHSKWSLFIGAIFTIVLNLISNWIFYLIQRFCIFFCQ